MKKYCKCGHAFSFHEFKDDILFPDELLVRCTGTTITVIPHRKEIHKLCNCSNFEVA